ncbi:MAG: DUF4954 family protein [Bacteroidales bacterium]|nr:DUF4954 family protein [Bacteroidales bacterium]
MNDFRHLMPHEIETLHLQGCAADNWETIIVANDIDIKYIRNVRFSGEIKLGAFKKSFELPGGIKKHSGIFQATLHNVTVGDDCCIENIKNYIANYDIENDCFIENCDIILVDSYTSFGNGVEVAVLNETGGREVVIHNLLSAQEAYMEAMYRHHPKMTDKLKQMASDYAKSVSSNRGTIGSHCVIVDSGYIKNVYIGDYCKIEGSGRLKNGSLNSNEAAPIHIGYGVVCDDFIISSGSSVEDGTMLTRCFVGQACTLGHTYSASDSLFFSNCQEENGEACAIFAGPFTVTHHKSTLLIAGMFSFMNAGSGSNQSNHMYKLGPIHQGVLERGSKTTSDSYILWPSRVGAFSLIMGRHYQNLNTSDLPFSYLIEKDGESWIFPGVNLRSVGTVRDAQKWPKRDKRKDPMRLDAINYNLLSPFTIAKMLRGIDILKGMSKEKLKEYYAFQAGHMKNSSREKGIMLYNLGVTKFLGNSVISRLIDSGIGSDEELRARLKPYHPEGAGEWIDLSGMIAPKKVIEKLIVDIEHGEICSTEALIKRFAQIHEAYYDMEWTWAYEQLLSYFNLQAEKVTAKDIIIIVEKWIEAVTSLDMMLYKDAAKEFDLTSMTGFGADGSEDDALVDFSQVRGQFDTNPVVQTALQHIEIKTALGKKMISQLSY